MDCGKTSVKDSYTEKAFKHSVLKSMCEHIEDVLCKEITKELYKICSCIVIILIFQLIGKGSVCSVSFHPICWNSNVFQFKEVHTVKE